VGPSLKLIGARARLGGGVDDSPHRRRKMDVFEERHPIWMVDEEP
jgi:hypothetical protein